MPDPENNLPNTNPSPPPRKRGGQPGNRNAVKHGFYSRSWKYRDLKGLDQVDPVGLADEIALLRVCIRRLAESFTPDLPQDQQICFVRTLSQATHALNRMIRTQQITAPDEETELRQVLDRAINEVTQELGLDQRFPQ
jgi:hypothetical protein